MNWKILLKAALVVAGISVIALAVLVLATKAPWVVYIGFCVFSVAVIYNLKKENEDEDERAQRFREQETEKITDTAIDATIVENESAALGKYKTIEAPADRIIEAASHFDAGTQVKLIIIKEDAK